MIIFDRVCFGYPQRKPLFENLSLVLEPGHIYGLLGKNGEGKSTLLRNMAGLLFPDSGEIRVNGFKPAKRQAEFLQEVIYIPEEPYLPSCTVLNFSKNYGLLYPEFNSEQFDADVVQFGISKSEELGNLSYGQRKKVAIAFAFACNTNILLMDEPTNGLDIPSKMVFRKLLLSAFDEKRIMIMATHQVRDMENLIDSVIILNENKVAIHATTEEVSQLLSFQTRPRSDQADDVLFAQNSPDGFKVVTQNIFGSDSQTDLETLFTAVIGNPTGISEIFDQLPRREISISK